jgi:hypothetical protein
VRALERDDDEEDYLCRSLEGRRKDTQIMSAQEKDTKKDEKGRSRKQIFSLIVEL